MNKNKLYYLEKARILMAQELDISPDEIDINALREVVFRAIRESYKSSEEDIMITVKSRQEEEAVLGDYGQIVINRIFSDKYPFEGVADNYKEWYISIILNDGGI